MESPMPSHISTIFSLRGGTTTIKGILFLCVLCGSISRASGAYEHGTSTGKGQLQLDLTWNPFNLIKFGQSYAVLGYGVSDKLDLHGYYAFHPEGFQTYYYGFFYQFLEVEYLDLATAVGLRTNTESMRRDLFFPQILYNVKLGKDYTVGGSIVSLQDMREVKDLTIKTTVDVSLFIPLHRYLSLPQLIHELKFGVGVFNPATNLDVKPGQFLPTYSVDIKFRRKSD